MKSFNISGRLILALALITAIAACAHLYTRPVIAENTLIVRAGTHDTPVDFDALTLERVTGETVNGKGEVKDIDADGISVRDLLTAAGLTDETVLSVTVTAADGYSAALTGEEIAEDGKVYLIRRDETSLQLVVFGDSDSRRSVRDVALIECEVMIP